LRTGGHAVASCPHATQGRLTDQASRFLVEVRIVDPTWAGDRGALERVFDDIGLPAAIRSDNGTTTSAGTTTRIDDLHPGLGCCKPDHAH
jgi:hypothetical protein